MATLEDVAKEILKLGRDALPVVCDISDAASVAEMFRKWSERWGKLDILVNNAGESQSELLARISPG